MSAGERAETLNLDPRRAQDDPGRSHRSRRVHEARPSGKTAGLHRSAPRRESLRRRWKRAFRRAPVKEGGSVRRSIGPRARATNRCRPRPCPARRHDGHHGSSIKPGRSTSSTTALGSSSSTPLSSTRPGCTFPWKGHHKHAYYLIRHAELRGFTQEQVAVIANLARYHRKAKPSAEA
jgi:hypothetical protein